jgi:hypothetical protein
MGWSPDMDNYVIDVQPDDPMQDPIFDVEYQAFDVYFASIVAMQFHPGAGTREHRRLTLAECRDEAIEMLKLRRHIPCINFKQYQEQLNHKAENSNG